MPLVSETYIGNVQSVCQLAIAMKYMEKKDKLYNIYLITKLEPSKCISDLELNEKEKVVGFSCKMVDTHC